MEPTSQSIVYTLYTRVLKCEEKFREEHPNKTDVTYISLGWFVQFEGMHDAIRIASHDPCLIPGAEYEISIRKLTR